MSVFYHKNRPETMPVLIPLVGTRRGGELDVFRKKIPQILESPIAPALLTVTMTGHGLPLSGFDDRHRHPMGLAPQTISLFQAARHLVHTLPADAVLLYTETDLDWDAVQRNCTAAACWSPPGTVVDHEAEGPTRT